VPAGAYLVRQSEYHACPHDKTLADGRRAWNGQTTFAPGRISEVLKRTSAFTVIELLVVVAIIIALAAAGMAATTRMQAETKVVKCLNNLRTIGTAAALYSADNAGEIPQSSHQGPAKRWQITLPPYMGDRSDAFKSPFAANPKLSYSYAINDFLCQSPYGAENLNFSYRQNVPAPGKTLFFTLMTASYGSTDHFHFADKEDTGYTPTAFNWQVLTNVSQKCGHYLFLDGHVEAIPWETVKAELVRPGSQFIDPRGYQP
jgi:prepilin-type processing-associated H-X9-DG protein